MNTVLSLVSSAGGDSTRRGEGYALGNENKSHRGVAVRKKDLQLTKLSGTRMPRPHCPPCQRRDGIALGPERTPCT